MRCYWIIFVLSLYLTKIQADSLLVETSTGPIQGVKIPGKCSEAHAWYGIPYAKPPVKELRYKRPVPVEPWTETLKADTKPKGCHQIVQNTAGLAYIGLEDLSEDCLYLNVVTPTKINAPLPVMVWIHGGSFKTGATRLNLYDTECLSNIGQVVTVSIGYRLANLGFLYLGEETASGNVGLLDQQLALKWVKKNIKKFGGDPDQITIHGQSAGGASVSFHLISEGSQDLFKHAIVQSGTSIGLWSWTSNEHARQNAKSFAARVGCTDTSDHEKLLTCLQEVNAQKLVESETHSAFPEFPPTIDGLFITDEPLNLFHRTDFTGRHIMIGTTSHEGDALSIGFLYTAGTDSDRIPYNLTKNDAKNAIDAVIDAVPHDIPEGTRDIILKHYSEETDTDYFNILSDGAIGDPLITCTVNNLADILAKNGAQVYKYVFSYGAKNSPLVQKSHRSTHSDELFFMFGEPLKKDSEMKFSLFEKLLSKRTIRYWTDFAKTGQLKQNLLQKWPLYDEKDKKYVDITLLCTSAKENFRGEYCDFFRKLIAESEDE